MKLVDKSLDLFPGYLITPTGDIISLNFNKQKGVCKSLQPYWCGEYKMVRITGGAYLVHRLVALCWVPNPSGKPHVNHKDGNKLNNHASNLEWVTRSENVLHAYRVLKVKHSKSNLGNRYGDSFRTRPVIQMDLDDTVIKKFDCIRRASHDLNIKETAISNALNGRAKTAGKYKWKYA